MAEQRSEREWQGRRPLKPREDMMVEKLITPSANVIDLARYFRRGSGARAVPLRPTMCRFCGAALAEGEREDECSASFSVDILGSRLRWQAAQILRGLS